MMNPPLSIKDYFFPHIQVTADSEFSRQQDDNISPTLKTQVHVEKDPEINLFQVTLEIDVTREDKDQIIPYEISLLAVGLFVVDEDWDDPEKLLGINGASILYSAAREYLITITSRGPWPALVLPTVSFLPPEEETEKKKKKTRVVKKK